MPSAKSPLQPLGLEVGTPTSRPTSGSPPMTPARSPQRSSTPFYCIMSNLYEGLPSLKLEIVFQSITTKLQRGSYTRSILSSKSITCVKDLYPSIYSGDEELLEVLQPLVVKISNRANDPRSIRVALDKFTGSNIPPRFHTMLKSFFSNTTPIIDDFAVQTFYSAARTGNINLLKLFIELGILRSSRKGRWGSHAKIIGVTALQFSIEYRQGPSTSLLLRNDIDVNVQPVPDLSQTVLKTAVEVRDLELVHQPLDMGAQDIVFSEIYVPDPVRKNYLEELQNIGLAWVNNILQIDTIFEGMVFTALHSAIILEDDNIFEAVLRNRTTRKENGQKPIPFDSLLHILATRMCFHRWPGGYDSPGNSGNSAKVTRLRSVLECDALHIDINGSDLYDVTALGLVRESAIGANENLEDNIIFKLLVSYGANIKSQIRPRLFECEVDLFSNNLIDAATGYETTKILRSIENISGDLLSGISNDQAGNIRIEFQFYSTEEISLDRLHLENYNGVYPSSTVQPGVNAYPEEILDSSDEDEVLEILEEELALYTEGHGQISIAALHQARQMGDLELSLAVHSNSHETTRKIILHSLGADKASALEATWNGDNATFDLVFNHGQHKNDLGVPPELLTLIAIHIGHIYKVVRLLSQGNVDANHVLESGTTFLETAAALGRLDIAQVLLNAGASHRLPEAKVKVEQSGHFAVSNIINEQIKRLQPDETPATPSDLPTPSAASSGPSTDIATPAPITA
ncbi:uncharacterized protein DFL_006007 [Arthrobotrys flagrans]|uniref:Uncharacterized protein n=1 Tax=Arthrobotrys flagrans TaxID=97331 RepID=A0A436ZZY1_ARTFL|nr:hypothetical protein DFL_006007 [Arthrobotrys flagrans]